MENNFYVVTGGPGAGKTTFLNALATLGFKIVPEDAGEIIKKQIAKGGDGLPWKNKEYYTHLMLEGSKNGYQRLKNQPQEICFFDSGIIDALCYADMIGMEISTEMEGLAKHIRYNKIVFMLPPWHEIYKTDLERKQTWEEAVFTYVKMKETYTRYGYEIVEVPKNSIENRVKFVLNKLKR